MDYLGTRASLPKMVAIRPVTRLTNLIIEVVAGPGAQVLQPNTPGTSYSTIALALGTNICKHTHSYTLKLTYTNTHTHTHTLGS